MRWRALFEDLEAQLTAAESAEQDAEVADRTRREVARLGLADRARMAAGSVLTLGIGAVGTVGGELVRVGRGWWLLRGATGELLVVLDAVTWVSGLPVLAADPDQESMVGARLGLGYALRGIARDRLPVTLLLRDASTVTGTIDRVGADFVDVAEHAPGERRRSSAVLRTRTVPFGALAVVRAG